MNRVPDTNQGVAGVDASVHAGTDEVTPQDPQLTQQPVKPPTTYSRWGINSSGQPPATQYWPARANSPTSTPAQGAGKSSLPSNGRTSHRGGQPPPPSAAQGDDNTSSTSSSPSFRAGGQIPSSTATQSDGNNTLTFSPSFRAGGQTPSPTDLSTSPSNHPLNSVYENSSGNPTRQQSRFNSFATNPTENGPASSQRFKPESSPVSPQPTIDGVPTPLSQYQSELNDTSHSMSHLFPRTTFPSKRDLAEAKKTKHHPQQKPVGSAHAGPVAGAHSNREKPARPRFTTKGE